MFTSASNSSILQGADFIQGQNLSFPSPFPESQSSDFWTGGTPRESPVSSINSSLHGRPTFDPQEQNPTFLTNHRRDSSASRNISPALPPPPVELGKVLRFECDICGRKIQVARRLEWQWVLPSVSSHMLTCSIRRHVLTDLRPYICTFPFCSMANDSFASRPEFLSHEIMMHGLARRFRLKDCVSVFEQNVHRYELACHFCKEELSEVGEIEYARHVGRHMEEIAFAVVTKPYEDWEFYSDCSGKSNKNLA